MQVHAPDPPHWTRGNPASQLGQSLHTCIFIFSIFIAPGCCLFLCHKYQRYKSKTLIGNPDLNLQNLDHHRQDIKNYCEGVTNQLHLRCNTSEGDTNGGGSDDV